MSTLVPQQIKDDFLQSLVNYTAVLQARVDAAEAANDSAQSQAGIANTKAGEAAQALDATTAKAAEAVLSALASYDWANKAEDVVVQNGEFSAYHHRRKAEIAAQQVLTALAGSVVFKGQWNASSNSFPTGTSAGWMYRINAGGTLTFEDAGTKLVGIGDYILKTDTGWTYIDEATDAVKTSRTINGKALNVDIVLTPADVNAVAIADLATQAIAEAGTDDAKWMSSLKTRQALQKMGIGLTAAPPAITNIDAFDTPTGMYRTASGTTGTFPNANVSNFTLIVTRVSATAVNQILIYIDGHMWVRGSSGSVWTTWKGATPQQYGIGGAMIGTPTLDLNDLRTGGIWITDNVAAVNIPTGWPQARYSVIVCGSETYTTQIITNQSATSGVDVARMAVRRMRNLGTWSAWYEIWTSNSLIKQVSATDNTAGSVLLSGAGGLVVGNALDAGASSLNADSLINGTIHRYETTEAAGTALNLPAIGGAGSTARHWVVFTYGIANRKVQEATEVFGQSTTKARKYIRVFQDSTWSTWKYLWDTDNLVKQTTTTDNTAGRVLLVGAAGLLGYAQTWGTDNDANLINVTGFFRVNTDMLNVPAGVLGGSVIVNYQYDNDDQYQEIFDRNDDVRYYRRRYAGSWKPWFKMFHSGSPISDHPELATKLDILSLQVALAI